MTAAQVVANFPLGLTFPKTISAKISPVTTPKGVNNKIFETSFTGDKSTGPTVFKTNKNFSNFSFKYKISLTSELVKSKSPFTAFLSSPSDEVLATT